MVRLSMKMTLLICVLFAGPDLFASLQRSTNCGCEESPKVVLLAGDDFDLEELNISIRPRFSLGGNLTMGNWSYKAYRVTNRRTGEVSLALQLNVEIRVGILDLPPLSVDANALNRDRREVGSGFLIPKSFNMGRSNVYSGFLLMTSFDVDEIHLTPG